MKIDLRREIMLWAVLLAPMTYLTLVWNQLPEQVPIHWNTAGEIDGWASKHSLPLFVGGLQLGIYLLMRVLPHIDPRRMNIEASVRAYQRLRVVLGLLFGFIGFLMVHSALHQEIDLPGWLVPGLFFFLAAIGNYLYSLRSNYFIGIRTPWTLEYPEIWERTHRFGGKLWFWCGLVGGVLAFLLPGHLLPWTMGIILLMAFAPIIYSFMLFRQGVGRPA
jgi:uncharacterized membrane protein